MFQQINIQQFYVLPTQRIYVFVRIREQTAIISLYSINWLVLVTETECVYCEVRAEYLYKNHINGTHYLVHPIDNLALILCYFTLSKSRVQFSSEDHYALKFIVVFVCGSK